MERLLDELSTELFNSEVSIEIIGGPGPPQVEALGLALQTLAYDHRDDVFEVAGARGATHVPSVVRRLVDHPERIAVDALVAFGTGRRRRGARGRRALLCSWVRTEADCGRLRMRGGDVAG